MLDLNKDSIYVKQHAQNKQEAIKLIASALTRNNFVDDGYVNGMLERESQAATFIGSGIAIPHGTTTTRHLVKKTGVQVFCFPDGVEWSDDGEKAYIAIGIAASSDEHLELLRNLTHVLSDEDVEEKIKKLETVSDVISLLTGKAQNSDIESILLDDLISLDVNANNLKDLFDKNITKLKECEAIDESFYVDSSATPLYLGQGIWICNSNSGNLKNAVAIARTNSNIQESNKFVNLLITIAAKTKDIKPIMQRLAKMAYERNLSNLHSDSKENIISRLKTDVKISSSDTNDSDESKITNEFTILNSHGLHTRPASFLVKIVKNFDSKVTVANLDGTGDAVSAISLMKMVALGAKKGARLQFVAEGHDAIQALEAIGLAISEGLGEEVE